MIIHMVDILNSKEALERLVKERLPVKTAYRLQKLIEKLNSELATYDKLHFELVQKYGNSEGEGYRVPEERMPEFLPEFEELIGVEVELDFLPLDIEDLGKAEISVADLTALKYLFT